ncbi:Protein FAR1-RELATED SEQUENCE 5 [Bienertia sinuspersici]
MEVRVRGKPDARVRPTRKLLNGVSDKGVQMANRKTKKVGCPVMLHAKFVKEGEWQIRSVVLEISTTNLRFHTPIHGALAVERNGVEDFPVSEDSLGVRNIVDKERQLKMMDGDKIYTSAKFLEVQHECMKNLDVSVVGSKEVDDKLVSYTIEDRVWVRDPNTRKDIPTRRKRRYEVKYNMKTNEAWCVCKLMESAGIICRHIIAVFERK